MIAVTFALPAESSAFIPLLQNRSRENRAGIEIVSGELHGRAIAVVHTGVGEKSTRMRLAKFLEAKKPSVLISAGFAGALRESLAVGDLLLADNRSTPAMLPIAQRALIDGQATSRSTHDRARRHRFGCNAAADRAGNGCGRGRYGNRIHCGTLRALRHSDDLAACDYRHAKRSLPCPTASPV